MSEFVELNANRWVLRSEIIAFRVVDPGIFYAAGQCNPDKFTVLLTLRGDPDEWTFEFGSLDEAKVAVRKIRGVVPSECTEWVDSRIVYPSLSINSRTQDSPILWGRWYDGSECPFRARRTGSGVERFEALFPLDCTLRNDGLVAMPDFWRHLPVEEKIEILDLLHKAKNEGADEARP